MFCVYHKKFYFREDNFYFTFFGVNEVYSKEKTCNNIKVIYSSAGTVLGAFATVILRASLRNKQNSKIAIL